MLPAMVAPRGPVGAIRPVKPLPERVAGAYILRVRRAGRRWVFELIDLRSGECEHLAGLRALSRWLTSRPGGLR
jgi:nucleoside-triphosphatase THEP1